MSAMKRVITAIFLLVGMAAWVHAQSAQAILGEWEITTV